MPCRDCTERKVGCHSTCEKYLAFRKRVDDWHKKRELAHASEPLPKKRRKKYFGHF